MFDFVFGDGDEVGFICGYVVVDVCIGEFVGKCIGEVDVGVWCGGVVDGG